MDKMDEKQVTVADMMAARDARAARQAAWLAQHGQPLVSMTLNIAGPVKVTPLVARGFALAVRLVDEHLARCGMQMAARARFDAHTGLEALWAVAADALEIKRRMVEIEDDGAFGRLLDLDVIGMDGMKVGREQVGRQARRCLLCGRAAMQCARSRAHSVEALFQETGRILRERVEGQFADDVAAVAERALLYEVAITPKPGLVDRANNGAHSDMDFFTFLRSASVLTPYFRRCVEIGLGGAAPEAVFAALRYPGMRAEEDMLRATGGVNTHKGAIFSLGILCGAAGLAYAQGTALDAAALCALCAEMTGSTLRTEMQAMRGALGARGEVAAGFPSVLVHGLPAFQARLAAGDSMNDAGVYALISLMAHVEDANICRRGGAGAAKKAQTDASALLKSFSIEGAAQLDRALTGENLSPGGCADLLAVTLFLHAWAQVSELAFDDV